jgi:hypothetical protein
LESTVVVSHQKPMQLTRPIRRPRRDRTAHPRPEPAPRAGEDGAQARAKRSGGPEDEALYTCGCGFAFKAAVTTSVGCPECGADQAW